MIIDPQLFRLLPDLARERFAASGRLCLSGAAPGADCCWAAEASARGDGVVHWSFPGHHRGDCAGEIVALPPALLAQADVHLARAAASLARPWPPRSPYAAGLLRRDWFQVAWAEAVYAVGTFGADGRIEGGTAWTVQLFLERFDGADCPAFLLDQDRRCWLEWRARRWQPLALPPVPAGIWAGIGTRELREEGIAAIAGLMGGIAA